MKIFRKIPSKWASRIKRTLFSAALVAVGFFAAMYVLGRGVEIGRVVGHCEVACSIMGAQFTSLDGETKCQCQYGSGWVMSIPMDHGFFDYEEIETDEILENK